MNSGTLPVFDSRQFGRARILLATRVAEMMGRKLEENDWAQTYCAAKDIPVSGWSNTDIDIVFGHMGVEQKAFCVRSGQAIKTACGTTIMHPAGTRAIRIPSEPDPTLAAQDVLRQYGAIIARRRVLVEVLNSYHHGRLTRQQTIDQLTQKIPDMSAQSASRRVPIDPVPTTDSMEVPDLRTGWLLWQETLREFLYFEEQMVAPDPTKYRATWNERLASGSRGASRNLWVFDKDTGEKRYSITTVAGAKIQPYFKVPVPDDPNLYHFVVQGEDAGNDLVRVWLTKNTLALLRSKLGSLEPASIAAAIDTIGSDGGSHPVEHSKTPVALASEILIPRAAYTRLVEAFRGVSDEHNFMRLVDFLSTAPES